MAEQDRYQTHFGNPENKIKDIKESAASKLNSDGAHLNPGGNVKGSSEQDIYGQYFATPESESVKKPTGKMFQTGSGAEQDIHGSHFGVSGIDQLRKLASLQGVGAEQVCYLQVVV